MRSQCGSVCSATESEQAGHAGRAFRLNPPLSFQPTGGFIAPAMTHEELLDGLKELLRRHKEIKADPGALTLDTRIDQIGFDSLSILDFIYDIEDRFKIQTQMADLVSMVTVRDLVNYVQQRRPQ